MLIQVDVDNTLYSAHTLFAKVAKTHYDIDLKTPSNWHEYLEYVELDTLRKIFRKSHSRQHVMRQKPYGNSVETLNWLAEKNHQIIYISDRHGQANQALYDWLKEKNFPIDWSLNKIPVVTTKDKRSWMIENNPDVVIDDRPRTLMLAQSIGAKAIGLEFPWNRNLRGEIEGIQIFKNWKEIASYLG